LSGKKTAKDMWEALIKLYQSDNQSRKMLLKEELRSTKMAKEESVVTYLTKFTQIRDELTVVGEAVDEMQVGENSLEWLHQTVGSICLWSCGSREAP
jgi:hypothetical protein